MPRRIAIVEDDPAIRTNYADALRKHGFEVLAFAARGEALAALRSPKKTSSSSTSVQMSVPAFTWEVESIMALNGPPGKLLIFGCLLSPADSRPSMSSASLKWF